MPKFRIILNGNLIFKFFVTLNFFIKEKIKLRFFTFQYFKKFVKGHRFTIELWYSKIA